MKKEPAINPNDFVSVESGTDDVYVPFDGEVPYDPSKAIDDINGEVIAGGLEDKIDYLAETKEDIKDAIEERGIGVEDDVPFREYADMVKNIAGVPSWFTPRSLVDGVLRAGYETIDLAGVVKINCSFHGVNSSNDRIRGVAFKNAEDLREIGTEGNLGSAFSSCRNVTSTGLDYLEVISGGNKLTSAFTQSGVVGTGLGNLKRIEYGNSCFMHAFSSCSDLQSMDFDNLEYVDGDGVFYLCFANDKKLKEANFNKLKTLSGDAIMRRMFEDSGLTVARFPMLDVIEGRLGSRYGEPVFSQCVDLGDVYFGGLKASTFETSQEQFAQLFGSTTGRDVEGGCKVHFPENFDPENPDKTFDITTLAGYPTFGGSANYIHVVYDLPATE